MRVCFTGGSGMIGRTFKKMFHSYLPHDELVCLAGPNSFGPDLTDPDQTYWALKESNATHLIHAAAFVGGIGKNSDYPTQMLSKNLKMGLNVLESAKDLKFERIYTLGTTCIYPKYCPIPFKEDDIWNGLPEGTNRFYSESKRALLLLGEALRQQYGTKITYLIPENLIGPLDNFDLRDSHVAPALIRKCLEAKRDGIKYIECWGSGSASRSFLFSEDLCEALFKCLDLNFDSELPINLGTGHEITIKDLAELIASLTEFDGEIRFTGDVSDGQPRRALDTSRAKKLLNWEAKTSLSKALTTTIQWYKEKEKL